MDTCVTTALAFVTASPASPAARYVDLGGSIAVAVYLVMMGILTLRGKTAEQSNEPQQ